MALKTVIPFPIFAPTPVTTTVNTASTTTEIRFSRWNNANSDKFLHQRRTQQQIEDDLRRHRRFESALNIANLHDSTTSTTTFKSTGTPSTPSLSSIPGKKSKYSKENPNSTHPAFRKVQKKSKLPQNEPEREVSETTVKVKEDGLSYVIPGAPFEFMYSYTETPKVKPVALREPPVAPFGPGTMPRPWTGRKPLPPSKKKLPEFDSFTPPPANKKGVKPVQKPGPYLPGSGPRYVMSREEILGEPLTVEEVKDLVEGCRKTKRQLKMGRDGLTHNMLDNIHAHWKRRRVCKIKCKGVCTVDMDNVCQQLEERTGGKIIYRRGGIVYLFRGRNYNYKIRPRFPLMLWKPVTPVYPRLIKRVPEGLTSEEATDMRKRGRELPPICKLGKNGVYVNLVKNVREAFEACELVRVNCQGLNPSDYRRIGAKLKDLVPCVLISFENEHILMWRGRDFKSSLLLPEDSGMGVKSSETDKAASLSSYDDHPSASEDEEESTSCSSNILIQETSDEMANVSMDLTDDSDVDVRENSFGKDDILFEINGRIPPQASAVERQTMCNFDSLSGDDIKSTDHSCNKETGTVHNFFDKREPNSTLTLSDSGADVDDIMDLKAPLGDSPALETCKAPQAMTQNSLESSASPLDSPCTGVLFLLKQAVEDGSAMILDDSSLDADVVYERSVAFAQVAPPGPVFRHRPRKISFQKCEKQETGDLEADKEVLAPENKSNVKKPKERKSSKTSKAKDFKEEYLNVVPQGSLKVDELAKLLA